MGANALDTRLLRNALGQFPTGVCIVTAMVEETPIGVTISSFNTLSLSPPLALFSIDNRALSLPAWERAEGYAVNVLAQAQRELSGRFAKSLGDKWEGIHFERGIADAPVFNGTAAVFECVPWGKHDGGDHRLFLAEIRRFRFDKDRQPLVFAQGRYGALTQSEPAPGIWPLDIHY
jgi:flavin reductase (DIM6/NTAB) family NADH-FMN oxidoreductase RutF